MFLNLKTHNYKLAEIQILYEALFCEVCLSAINTNILFIYCQHYSILKFFIYKCKLTITDNFFVLEIF